MVHLRLLFLVIIIGIETECSFKVKLLHVLFRHGDKVPHKEYQSYPTDPHGNHSYFPMESGDLTNKGKLREYQIGVMLRDRYDDFLGPDYHPSLIFARSTELARTQMSLQLVLAGLFPPSKRQTWNPHLPWIPVSTVSVPYDQDSVLFPQYCPKYIKEYKKFLASNYAQKIVGKYNETMKYLSKHTGKQVNTTSAVYYLYNLFKEEAAQNLELPEWIYKVYPSPMEEITALDFHLRSFTKELKRLNGGLLLREIVESMKALRNNVLRPQNRKAFLYSAHEVNVVALARTLGTNKPSVPPYGSTVVFETLMDENKKYYIRMLLWMPNVTEYPVYQTVPGCVEYCLLDDFLKILDDVIPTAEEADCHNESKHNMASSYRMYAVLIPLNLFIHITVMI